MKKTVLQEITQKISAEKKIFIKKQAELAIQLVDIIKRKKITQRKISELTGMKEPFISRILHGGENPTLKTIAKFEAILGEEVLVVPKFFKQHKVVFLIDQPGSLPVSESSKNIDVPIDDGISYEGIIEAEEYKQLKIQNTIVYS